MNSFDWREDELYHHGIKGQKWGIRRYQNEDGSLTTAGRSHYGYGNNLTKAGRKAYIKEYKKLGKLQDRANISLQKKNAEKYNRRASMAGRLGLGLAGAAASSLAGGKLSANLIGKAGQKDLKGWDDIVKRTNDAWRDVYNPARWFSSDESRNAVGRRAAERYYNAKQNRENAEYWLKERQKSATTAGNTSAKIIGAAAGAALGYAAYSKIRAKIAENRMSDIGHAKAVEKLKAQKEKMMTMFGDVKISEIMTDNKNKKK